jgi:peptide/nickel transport system ATP-binding protein
VLAARPDVIVADEPASSLDLPSRQALVDLLDRIRSARGIALLLISHDLRLVRGCCSRIGVLDAGGLVEIVGAGRLPASAAGLGIWPDEDWSAPDPDAAR